MSLPWPSPELPLVVGQFFRGAVFGRALQDHDVDRAGVVPSAGPHATLPVPRGAQLDVGYGECTAKPKTEAAFTTLRVQPGGRYSAVKSVRNWACFLEIAG